MSLSPDTTVDANANTNTKGNADVNANANANASASANANEEVDNLDFSYDDSKEGTREDLPESPIEDHNVFYYNKSPIEDHNVFMTAFAGVAGNILEWYDFSVFGFFSDIIGDVFFPVDESGNSNLVKSFLVFGVAFLVRPIGGAIIGSRGDTVGTKSALESSIFLMAFPTFALGCLPKYSTVGWVAPFLLVIMRLLQGLSVGGQLMSSVVFTLERTDISRWGLWGSSVFAASSLGVFIGSLFSYVLRETLTDQQLEDWGWRVPFLFGAFGILPGAYLKLRATNHSIPSANNSEPSDQGGRSKLAEVFSKSNRRALLASILLPCLPAAAYYIIMIWTVTFMENIIDPPISHAFAINTAVVFLSLFGSLLGGWVADLYGNYFRIMIVSGALLGICSPLFFHFIGFGNPGVAFVCQLTLALFLSIFTGAMLPCMVKMVPPHLRLTSMSIGYNIALALCGGFAPAIATSLAVKFGPSKPGYVITFVAILSVIGLFILPEEGIQNNAPKSSANGENLRGPRGRGIEMTTNMENPLAEREIA